MCELVGQLAVIGQDQQALGSDVQPADREDPGLGWHEVDDGGPPFGVRGAANDPDRLVEQVVDIPLAHGQRDAVNGNVVVGSVRPLAEAGRLAVDHGRALRRSAPRTPGGCLGRPGPGSFAAVRLRQRHHHRAQSSRLAVFAAEGFGIKVRVAPNTPKRS